MAWYVNPTRFDHNQSLAFKLSKKPSVSRLKEAVAVFLAGHESCGVVVDPLLNGLVKDRFDINNYFFVLPNLSISISISVSEQITAITTTPFNLHEKPFIRFYLFSKKMTGISWFALTIFVVMHRVHD